MKIVLLEDDVALNKAITKVLQIDKHRVFSFSDGLELSNKLNTFDSQLYILDINVPNKNGLTLLEEILSSDPLKDVIIISSNTDLQSLRKAYSLGCIDYLKKPFHLEELRIKINKLARKHSKLIEDIQQLIKPATTLTKKEKQLLELLMQNKNRLVAYRMIEERIYQERSMSMEGLRALVKRLRAKLENDCITNITDEGYLIKI